MKKPIIPIEPELPQKTKVVCFHSYLFEGDSLKNIIDYFEEYDLSQVHYVEEYDVNGLPTPKFAIPLVVENENYNQEMILYNLELIHYKRNLKEYTEKLKEYSVWEVLEKEKEERAKLAELKAKYE